MVVDTYLLHQVEVGRMSVRTGTREEGGAPTVGHDASLQAIGDDTDLRTRTRPRGP